MSSNQAPQTCINCEYARMAHVNGKVACGRIFNQEHLQDGCYKIFDELNVDSLTTGWAYMKRRPNSVSSGTVGEGLMTNHVIVFDDSFTCKYWKELR